MWIIEEAPAVTVDCPPWCNKEPGHGYETGDWDGAWIRFHSLSLPACPNEEKVDVWASAMEIRRPDGTVIVEPISANVDERTGLSAADLRQGAAALLNAADALDEATR